MKGKLIRGYANREDHSINAVMVEKESSTVDGGKVHGYTIFINGKWQDFMTSYGRAIAAMEIAEHKIKDRVEVLEVETHPSAPGGIDHSAVTVIKVKE